MSTDLAPKIEIRDLVDLLGARAGDVCCKLLPEGRLSHTRFQVGSLAGEPGQSLSVNLRGMKPGNWHDFASGERGDILDLIAQVLFRGHKGEAVTWALGYLGLSDADPDAMRTARREAEAKRRQAAKEAQAQRRRMRAAAWQRWGIEASPEIRGTAVERYLAGRGIDLDRLGSTGALRYHPELLSAEDGCFYPAMVAAIVGPDGRFLACHRTWLEVRTDGRVTKADLKAPKKCLGGCQGGHISIAKGRAGVPLNRAPQGDRCILIEGIEDALTLAMALPEWRIVATISVDGMAGVIMPASVTTRVLFRDRDTEPAALAGFERAKLAHMRQCRDVRVAASPGEAKDANAYLMETAA